MRVDNALNEEEIVFDGANIKCIDYIVKQLEHSDKNNLNFGKNNMMPIMKAFKTKLDVSQATESV